MWAGLSLFFLGWHYEKRGEEGGFRGFVARHRKHALLLGILLFVEVVRVLIGVL
ncbi:MAG: hypothetical protein GXO48_03025 [Chlorobi bacterium]|nr:hypothetical protein [Chlorobiota bacterium]